MSRKPYAAAPFPRGLSMTEPFAPRPAPTFTHCIHVTLVRGERHECGEPTNGAQRCPEHRACGPTGSRFHSVKTIRHTA